MIEQRPKRRSGVPMVLFLVLVFFVAVGGTFLGFQLFGGERSSDDSSGLKVITVEVLITTTPNPTQAVLIVTATDQPGQVTLPTGLAGTLNTSGTQIAGVSTIDPANLDAEGANVDASSQSVAGGTPLPENCILHVIVEGDTPFGVAEQYGANPFVMLDANGLTEEDATFLQIGDTLLVPLEGCDIDLPPSATPLPTQTDTPDPSVPTATAEVTEEPEFTPTITPTPTITLAPTATNAQIAIVDVESAGDITAEGIRLRNTGNTINVTGWSLTDAEGNTFSFPEQLLFSNAEVTIYTRAGTNTPVALFWGLDEAIWDEGDVLTLIDANDNVQATIRLPSEIDLE